MEKQLLTLKEAYIGLQAKLEDTQQELVQTQQSVAPLLQAAKESEEGKHAALVDMRRYECCLDIETVRSLRRREERELLKVEKRFLLDENQLLRDTLASLEAQEGPTFEDGYFTACYEVATALPPPFDLQAALNWDQDYIMARVAQLIDGDQEEEVPPQDAAHPGQGAGIAVGVQLDGAKEAVQNPPIKEEQTVNPMLTSEVVLVKEGEDPAGSGVPMVGGTLNKFAAVQEDAATQEDDPAIPQVPTVEGAHNDVEAKATRVEADSQGEHPEEEKED